MTSANPWGLGGGAFLIWGFEWLMGVSSTKIGLCYVDYRFKPVDWLKMEGA